MCLDMSYGRVEMLTQTFDGVTWENLLITQEGSLAHDYSESFLLRSAVCLGRRIKCSVKGLLILVFFF